MKAKKFSVIGLGYVGLPFALLCAVKGHQVVSFESNQKVVDIIKCYVNPSLAGLELNWKAEKNLHQMCDYAWRWTEYNSNGFKA